MTEAHFDIAIVGGGMVGSALACGLAQQGFNVTVLEREAPPIFNADAPPDVRVSAISCASVALLKQLGVWSAVKMMRVAPYRRLETWEWPTAKVSFDAASLGLPELGYMVENSVLQHALWKQLEALAVTCDYPARLTTLTKVGNHWHLALDNGKSFTARLVAGADGAHSQVRQLAGIGINGWDYAQSCMLITVKGEHPSGDCTWQQFTPGGPRAYLPLFDNWASLVWYDDPVRIRQLQSMSMTQLQTEIVANFPARLGQITPVAAGAFPLVRRHAVHYVLPGLVLAGDAAHTINPLAGQGVNLGYRDVDALLKVLITARNQAENWTSEEVLQRYQRERKRDNMLMQSSMDLFYLAFSNSLGPLKILRNLGLKAAENAGILKRQALRYALGL
ncbi:3-demethoxyubiquinol 3-hydroxylase [Enterobacteriaceae bacterium LUAb1]